MRYAGRGCKTIKITQSLKTFPSCHRNHSQSNVQSTAPCACHTDCFGHCICYVMVWNHFIIRLGPWAGKINQISRCDWLPERARWSYLASSGYGLCPARKLWCFPPYNNKSFIGKACSVKMAGYWPHSFFCVLVDLDLVSVHKHAKKNLANIQPSWPHAWYNPYIQRSIVVYHGMSLTSDLWDIPWYMPRKSVA